eukprot:TRINITY_DN490_c0_g1_i1.p1 TRINITY_DN490_c0_g1~~TRINITY_DN490_c0_g1_i1.p1  ORF type:complete len:141 (+),score=4.64 TRINITY_DN490_c0_g1_i1:78-500(+)
MVNILVGVDDSGYGIFAFQRALRIASPGDTMFLITVIDKGLRKKGRIAAENKKTFKKICAERDVRCVNLEESGSAKEVLVKQVDSLRIDVLVLASRGQGSLKKVFVGSTSDYCLRLANCSVLIAKKPAPHLTAMPYISYY